MLHKLKKSLFEILIKIDKNVSVNFEDVEVETLFDKKGDFTTNAALKFSKIFIDCTCAFNVMDDFYCWVYY